jgi:hypothetical protein
LGVIPAFKYPQNEKRLNMTQQGTRGENVSINELTLANTIQVDTLVQLLIEKGVITEQEFFTKLKEVQRQYQMQEGKS